VNLRRGQTRIVCHVSAPADVLILPGPPPVNREADRAMRLLLRRDGGSVSPRGTLTGALP